MFLGESATQPVTLYKVSDGMRGDKRNWIRVYPTTKQGAPARGATVTLTPSQGPDILKVIDSGSGYLCQMEPLAHFGLDKLYGKKIRVQWPDGTVAVKELDVTDDQRKVIQVPYPSTSTDSRYNVVELGAQMAAQNVRDQTVLKEEL